MAKRSSGNMIGSWAFLIGAFLAIFLGLFGTMSPTWLWVLVVLGIVVGLLNIAGAESRPFLWSGLALIIASYFGQSVLSEITLLNDVTQSLLALFVPATIVVALKNAFSLARN